MHYGGHDGEWAEGQLFVVAQQAIARRGSSQQQRTRKCIMVAAVMVFGVVGHGCGDCYVAVGSGRSCSYDVPILSVTTMMSLHFTEDVIVVVVGLY